MFLTGSLSQDISFADAGMIAGLGYGSVFLGLILLMVVIIVIGKLFSVKTKKQPIIEPVAEAPVEVPQPTAPGSAGQLKLHNVDPKTAAMLMAIVADKTGKPLNELRFISIKEVS